MDETGASGAPNEVVSPEDDLKGPHEVYEESGDTTPAINTGATGDPDVDMALELIVATFPDQTTAKAAFDEIREAEKQEIVLLVNAALVSRDQENKLHIMEEREMRGGEDALFGAGIGVVLGSIAGPLGWAVGGAAGAAVGTALAEGVDAGIPDDRLKEFADALRAGSSMVVVAVARYWSELVCAFLARAGGETKSLPLTAELVDKLDLKSAD